MLKAAYEVGAPDDGVIALRRNAAERLAVSATAEHLYLAAMLSEDPAEKLRLARSAVAANPADALVVWGGLQICAASENPQACPLREWEERLLQLDSHNSETWARVAVNRYQAGQHDAALDALRRAASAPETRNYWPETVAMIERGLAAATDVGFTARAVEAFEIFLRRPDRSFDVTRMCTGQAKISENWLEACLAYGQRAEMQARNLATAGEAQNIQVLLHMQQGNDVALQEVKQRISAGADNKLSFEQKIEEDMETFVAVVSDPDLFATYLARIREVGEEAARRQIAADVERLDDLQCGKAPSSF